VACAPLVGLLANPVSARDIRRVITNASNLQASDRASIILRALSALGACGIDHVLAMPDNKGIRTLLDRGIARERHLGRPLPDVEYVDMPITGTVVDTMHAARAMAKAGVEAIVVLGGDGTHRAVVGQCGDVPVAGISTGTNNAFPEMREATVTGLATGLFASGALDRAAALVPNKLLEVTVNNGERHDLALVDIVLSSDRFVGARALWHTENLRALFVSFADPQCVGMSSIAGLLEPIDRRARAGLHVSFDTSAPMTVRAPIAPGLVEPVHVAEWQRLQPDQPVTITGHPGVIALDGEREIEIDAGDVVTITLRCDAFWSIDVARCMQLAAERGLFRNGAVRGAMNGDNKGGST
jgi:predicted polyphosphate/ATP-dependent NAD kinase